MLKVGNAMVVRLHYTLKNEAGETLDSSDNKDPLTYLHGAGNIIEGLEDALEDLGVNDTFEVRVPAAKGYGMVQKRLIDEIPRDRFPQGAQLDVGERFMMQSPSGPTSIRVVAIQEDTVTIDANHELAGVDLFFTGQIVDIREGTPHELQHGHAHGPGGHQH